MTDKPKRIQRKRTKGWRMPEGAVYVGRGSRWGNPFIVGKHGTMERCVDLFRYLCAGHLAVSLDSECVDDQQAFLRGAKEAVESLRGMDLACWCRLDRPCHADVLLRIANQENTI